MSLNGLDDAAVRQAHKDTLAHPDGWLLLKYASRDHVDLLGAGVEGVLEMRNAITLYNGDTPLFGFLRHRGTSVLVKLVSEHCSRLVLARSKVHFVAIAEFFAPYDIEIEIASADELQEKAFLINQSPHTDFTPANTTEQAPPLEEIQEVQEEDSELVESMVEERISRPTTARPVTATSALSSHPPNLPLPQPKSLSPRRHDLDTSPPPPRTIIETAYDLPPTSSVSSRELSPSSSRKDSYNSPTRPKVRLVPRPSTDSIPTTAATVERGLISTLPAGLRLFPRKPSSDRLQSSPLTTKPPSNTPDNIVTVNLSTMVSRPIASPGTSAKSSRSAAVDRVLPNGDRALGMTPEKARLRKALQMRKNRQGQATPPPTSPLPPLPGSANPIDRAFGAKVVIVAPSSDHVQDTLHEDTLRLLKAMAEASAAATSTDSHDTASDATRTISTPASPTTSLRNPSTQASSVSESTDETVQDVHDDDEPAALMNDSAMKMSDIESLHARTTSATHVLEEPVAEIRSPEHSHAIPLPVDNSFQQGSAGYVTFDHSMLGREVAYEHSQYPSTSTVDLVRQVDIPVTRAKTFDDLHQRPSLSVAPNAMSKILEMEMEMSQKPDNRDVDATTIALPPSPVNEFAEPHAIIHDQTPFSPKECFYPPELNLPVSSGESAQIKGSMPPLDQIDTRTSQAPLNVDSRPSTAIQSPNPTITRTPPQRLPTPSSESQLPSNSVGDTATSSATTDSLNTFLDVDQTKNDHINSAVNISSQEELLQEIDATTVLYSPKRDSTLTVTSTVSTAAESESLSDDDDLMKELHEACVQQAQPMRVSKSPIRPFFSRGIQKKTVAMDYPKTSPKKSPGKENRHSRIYGSRYGDEKRPILRPLSQNGDVSRSSSAGSAYLKRLGALQQAPVVTKNVKVGSSISQRIKALQSNLAQDAATTPTQNAAPAFFSVKRASIRRNGRSSPSTLEKTMIDNIIAQRNTPSPSGSSLERADSAASHRTNMSFVRGPSPNGETLSTTARELNDHDHIPQTALENDRSHYEYRPLELRQSPLLAEHQQRYEKTQPSIAERRQSREINRTSRDYRRSSATIRDLLESSRNSIPVSDHRQSTIIEPTQPLPTLARPISIHQHTQTSPFPELSRPLSQISHYSTTQSTHDYSFSNNSKDYDTAARAIQPDIGHAPSVVDKNNNRLSQLISIIADSDFTSQRSESRTVTPTQETLKSGPPSLQQASLFPQQTQAPSAQHHDLIKSVSNQDMVFSSSPVPVTVSPVGDLNVQFPDSLLWKRRFVSLDSAGFLLLAQSQSMSVRVGSGAKKIHLSEFRTPFIPDEDCMEMPNSVVLEYLRNAEQLQFACIGRAEQQKVLKLLKDVHANWATEGL